MDNIFLKDTQQGFSWGDIGDIKAGRADLGEEMPVVLYRLMQFTIVDVLTKKYGKEESNNVVRDAGYLAGVEFTKNVLNTELGFDAFLAHLQESLKMLKVGTFCAWNPLIRIQARLF